MKVRIELEIYADIYLPKVDVNNSDCVTEYMQDLDAEIENNALHHCQCVPHEEIIIKCARPYDEGIDEYRDLISNYVKHLMYESKEKESMVRNEKEMV